MPLWKQARRTYHRERRREPQDGFARAHETGAEAVRSESMSTSSSRPDRSRLFALGALLAHAILLPALAGCATSGGAPQGELLAEAPRPAVAESAPAAAESAPAVAASKAAAPAAADELAFSLPAASGKQISRADLTRNGPAVIFFYRGSWCPSCRRQLRQISSVQATLAQRGVGVAAISADAPDEEKRMTERLGLQFPVLSDAALGVSRAYGAASGTDEFPTPALVVLRKDGTVQWKQVGEFSTDEAFAKLVVDRATEAGSPPR